MAVQVKLKDIIEGLECQADEHFSSLNMLTGEVVSVTREELRAAEEDEPLEDFPEWQHSALRIARDIVAADHYLPLPNRFDIHEYSIMERFCLSVEDDNMCGTACPAPAKVALHRATPGCAPLRRAAAARWAAGKSPE